MPFFIGKTNRDDLLRGSMTVLRAGLAGVLLGMHMNADAADNIDARRDHMVAEIEEIVRETQRETGRAALDTRVIAALRRVDRHRFVPQSRIAQAYDNRPLDIGQGQTISQPFIVALMTDLLGVGPGDQVLEVGTGSGYQAAVLAELVRTVYSIEIVEPLGREAARALSGAGYRNVRLRIGDGYGGWPEHAPFDAIIVTAAAPEVPQPLVDQLKPGGRLVIPVGKQGGVQTLYVIEKDVRGDARQRKIIDVRFVPLIRGKPGP